MNTVEILGERDRLKFRGTEIGCIYKVTQGSPVGAIVLRTNSDSIPFVNLETGECWGNSLSNYEFEKVTGTIKVHIHDYQSTYP
jgi:hypothetical protein